MNFLSGKADRIDLEKKKKFLETKEKLLEELSDGDVTREKIEALKRLNQREQKLDNSILNKKILGGFFQSNSKTYSPIGNYKLDKSQTQSKLLKAKRLAETGYVDVKFPMTSNGKLIDATLNPYAKPSYRDETSRELFRQTEIDGYDPIEDKEASDLIRPYKNELNYLGNTLREKLRAINNQPNNARGQKPEEIYPSTFHWLYDVKYSSQVDKNPVLYNIKENANETDYEAGLNTKGLVDKNDKKKRCF